MFPEDIRYTATHEWVRLKDGVAAIGITGYAADQLSDITYVELPAVGDKLAAGDVLGTIESVKAAADIASPLSGEIIEVNDSVLENPDVIGEDPYEDGWLVMLKPSDPSQLDDLMTSEAYQLFVRAESADEETEEDTEDDTEAEQ